MIFRITAALLLFLTSASAQVSAQVFNEKRFEAGGLFTGTFLREIGTRDAGIGTDAAGIGGRLVYRTLPFLDLESEMIVLPGNSATSGNHLQGFFGAKSGMRWNRAGLFVKARPGFIHFRRDPFGVGKPGSGTFSNDRASSTEASIDLGGVAEYYSARGLIFRFDLGDTVIRYARRTVQVSDTLQFQAGGFTTHNWQGSLGISFRF